MADVRCVGTLRAGEVGDHNYNPINNRQSATTEATLLGINSGGCEWRPADIMCIHANVPFYLLFIVY